MSKRADVPDIVVLPPVLVGGTLLLGVVLHHFVWTVPLLPALPARTLATDGPYRFTRNPLYISAIGVSLGIALWVNGLAPLLLLVPMMWGFHVGIVLPEERYLESKFGDEYRAYRTAIPRWF